MNSESIVITYETILWILGGIITIGGATAVISRWLAPFRKMKEEISSLREEVATLRGYQNGDHDRLKDVETGNEKICKCVLAIINHELTGNSVDGMKKARDEMQDYLIQK